MNKFCHDGIVGNHYCVIKQCVLFLPGYGLGACSIVIPEIGTPGGGGPLTDPGCGGGPSLAPAGGNPPGGANCGGGGPCCCCKPGGPRGGGPVRGPETKLQCNHKLPK